MIAIFSEQCRGAEHPAGILQPLRAGPHRLHPHRYRRLRLHHLVPRVLRVSAGEQTHADGLRALSDHHICSAGEIRTLDHLVDHSYLCWTKYSELLSFLNSGTHWSSVISAGLNS